MRPKINMATNDHSVSNGIMSRKKMRKAKLREKKMKKAIHFANKHNTNKICIKKDDIEKINKLNANSKVPSLLHGKILSNGSEFKNDSFNKPKVTKRVKKCENIGKICTTKKKDDSSDDESFKIVSNNSERLARLAEYVQKESNKTNLADDKPKKNKSSSEDQSNNSKHLIKDKRKLEDLRRGQAEDTRELNKLARNTHLSRTLKNKICKEFDTEFGDLIRDIESGTMTGIDETSYSLYNDGNEIADNLSLEENTDNLNNSHDESNDGVSTDQSDEDSSSANEKSDSESEDQKESHIDDFFDDEAEEGTTESDEGNDSLREDNETLAFEGGGVTSLSGSTNSPSLWSTKEESIFDLYSSESEESDLDGFIVDDDTVEYGTDDGNASESDIEVGRVAKRRRILSMSSETSEASINNESHTEKKNELSLKSILKPSKSSKNHDKRVSFPAMDEDSSSEASNDDSNKQNYHEDIYGRLRDQDGKVITPQEDSSSKKYIPPAQRKLMALNQSDKQKERLSNLHKKLKGLLNRLAESNMPGIIRQIETSFREFSRNDMNDTLTKLFMESLVTPVLTPDRLVQDHACLIATLSANVGSEVGAHIFTEFVVKFSEELDALAASNEEQVMSKSLDNLLQMIVSLYNFGVVDSFIIYDILRKLLESFQDKEVELILLVLRSVGFTLRKNDPLALKQFILKAQSKVSGINTCQEKFTRVRFMLEILTAIKNNNMYKVPNYDPSHGEHLRTLMKSMVRQGCSPGALKISLEDILKSKVVGKWWIVGSAWSGGLKEDQTNEIAQPSSLEPSFLTPQSDLHATCSRKFLKRAKRLHLAKPPRINILFALTEGAEGVSEAVDGLLQLKLPQNQIQEIFNIILICAERGKEYNPFYAQVALKLCKNHRKYKRVLLFVFWDKFKELQNLKPLRLKNLAKFLSEVIAGDAIGLDVFKHYPFEKLDSASSCFLRHVIISILLHPTGEVKVTQTFRRITNSPDSSFLRESLKLFILGFIKSKNVDSDTDKHLLSIRVKVALEILNANKGISL